MAHDVSVVVAGGVVDLHDSFTGTGAKAWSGYFEGSFQLLEFGCVLVTGTSENSDSGTGYCALNYTPTAVPNLPRAPLFLAELRCWQSCFAA